MSGIMHKSSRGVFAAIMLAGCLWLAGAPVAHSETRCERTIRSDQENLDKQVRKHGEHSRQADKAREKLRVDRERCH